MLAAVGVARLFLAVFAVFGCFCKYEQRVQGVFDGLDEGSKKGFTEIVEFLVTKGVDVNYRFLNGDATAPSLACSAGLKDIVEHLFKCGADPNIELKDRVTCVLEAARNGFVNIVEMMLARRCLSTASTRCCGRNYSTG
ncbi:unnamed protein product [Cylicocyclus nassatus]|uniref:Uncharacterized protein n=1 Tax=Cylicocyclus nassatus TaxID=53992 RepID=A0AA36GX62_CYLNA|nr:unnamed protein product [Cylicocyclus nassatus]